MEGGSFSRPSVLLALCRFKAELGIGAEGTSRSVAFCDHTIRQPQQLFIVEDALLDPRFCNNPLVTEHPKIRFYAGAPLVDVESGQAVGSMCVIDFVPRKLNELQRVSLKLLARQVMAACDSHRRIITLQHAMQQLEETRKALAASKEQAEMASQAKSQFLAVSENQREPVLTSPATRHCRLHRG